MKFPKDKVFLRVKDHSVSNEVFELHRDENLDLLSTFPKPLPPDLARYYDSEDYISHTDNKRSLFEIAYHVVKAIALQRKVSLINSLQPKGRLLDIGAGTGDFLALAKRKGWNVTGAEPSEKARQAAGRKKLELIENTDSLPPQSFDVITMWHVLEHVYDPELQVSELKRLLKPEGTIVIAVPNFNSYDANYYREFWAAYDVPRHLWHFSKTAIEMLFANQNIELKQILPMKFDAYYVALLSEKYRTGKMNFAKAVQIGLKSNLKGKKTQEYSSHIYVLRNKN